MKNFPSFQGACLSAGKHLFGIASIVLLTFCFSNPTRAQQNIYVSDYNHLDVDSGDVEYFPLGGGSPTVFVQAVRSPTGLIFGADNTLYISSSKPDANKTKINMFLNMVLGDFYSDDQNDLGQPHGLAFDASGNLYVATANGGVGNRGKTILKFTPPFMPPNLPSVFLSDSRFKAPINIIFDSQGNAYVSDPNAVTMTGVTGTVFKFSASGGQSLAIPFAGAYGMAFDSSGFLYVSSQTLNIVERFAANGTDKGPFVDNSDGRLSSPLGIVFDTNGNLYVANRELNTIERYNKRGHNRTTIGTTIKTDPHFLVIH